MAIFFSEKSQKLPSLLIPACDAQKLHLVSQHAAQLRHFSSKKMSFGSEPSIHLTKSWLPVCCRPITVSKSRGNNKGSVSVATCSRLRCRLRFESNWNLQVFAAQVYQKFFCSKNCLKRAAYWCNSSCAVVASSSFHLFQIPCRSSSILYFCFEWKRQQKNRRKSIKRFTDGRNGHETLSRWAIFELFWKKIAILTPFELYLARF